MTDHPISWEVACGMALVPYFTSAGQFAIT